jgi:hypothetical protein
MVRNQHLREAIPTEHGILIAIQIRTLTEVTPVTVRTALRQGAAAPVMTGVPEVPAVLLVILAAIPVDRIPVPAAVDKII